MARPPEPSSARMTGETPLPDRHQTPQTYFASSAPETTSTPRSHGYGARSTSRGTTAETEKGYGIGCTEWDKHALSAYTWMRTNPGHQRNWLYHVGKSENARCLHYGCPLENAHHLTFDCPKSHITRRAMFGNTSD